MINYQLIVIGASAGGLSAMLEVLTKLPPTFIIPIVIVQHQNDYAKSNFADILNEEILLNAVEVEDKQPIQHSTVYLAPPGYHLQIEDGGYFSLSVDDPIHYSRPSIDVLFESAAVAYKKQLIGILLTGANEDGASGLAYIQEQGGYIMVQDPSTAVAAAMPAAAINLTNTSHIYTLEDISKQILILAKGEPDA